MALASSVLMFAGSPQMFLGVATAQEIFVYSHRYITDLRALRQERLRANPDWALVFHRKAFCKIGSSLLNKQKSGAILHRNALGPCDFPPHSRQPLSLRGWPPGFCKTRRAGIAPPSMQELRPAISRSSTCRTGFRWPGSTSPAGSRGTARSISATTSTSTMIRSTAMR